MSTDPPINGAVSAYLKDSAFVSTTVHPLHHSDSDLQIHLLECSSCSSCGPLILGETWKRRLNGTIIALPIVADLGITTNTYYFSSTLSITESLYPQLTLLLVSVVFLVLLAISSSLVSKILSVWGKVERRVTQLNHLSTKPIPACSHCVNSDPIFFE